MGRLALSSYGDGLWWELADEAVHWPASLDVGVHGNRVSVPASRLYHEDVDTRAGAPDGRTVTISWANPG